jgi:predicted lipoprotein with Yx(FWY)xxD motif
LICGRTRNNLHRSGVYEFIVVLIATSIERSFKMKTIYAALAAALMLPGLVFAQVPTKTVDGVLTNSGGMTLYTFDKDAGSKSACNGPCAALWPSLTAAADAKASGDYSIVTRDDGSKQWAYKGKPLYVFSRDQKPGDKTGDGFANGVWHVAKP